MSSETSQEIRSKVTTEETIEISIASVDKPKPSDDEVFIKVEQPRSTHLTLVYFKFCADLNTIMSLAPVIRQ